MAIKRASIFSIALAEQIAVGHFNAGIDRYQKLQALVSEGDFDDETEKFLKCSEFSFSTITNLGLALEVLIKMHHFQISGEYPRGHDINELCSDLPEESLTIIRAKYRELHEDSSVHKGLSLRLEGGHPDREKKECPVIETTNFDDAVAYIGPMYIRWRYIYEEFQAEVDLQINFGPLVLSFLSVREAIQAFKGNAWMSVNPETN